MGSAGMPEPEPSPIVRANGERVARVPVDAVTVTLEAKQAKPSAPLVLSRNE